MLQNSKWNHIALNFSFIDRKCFMGAFIYDHRDEPWWWKNNELCTAISWNTAPTGIMKVWLFMFLYLSTLYFCHQCPCNLHWYGDSLSCLCIRILLQFWNEHYFHLHSLFHFSIKPSYKQVLTKKVVLANQLCQPFCHPVKWKGSNTHTK